MDTLIKVPDEAFVHNNQAQIKVEATQDHYIYSLGIRTDVTPLTEPTLETVTGTLNRSDEVTVGDGTVLETKPGDEFRFPIPTPKGNETHIVFRIHGYYVPTIDMTDEQLSQWWSTLGKDERALYIQ